MRLLLVEDDPVTAAAIELMLQQDGFAVDIADLGEAAIALAQCRAYDLIILDLLLPDLDGYTVLRQLRAARVKTPVLILSGLDAIEDKVRGFGLGADDFMTKPFEPTELVARIRAVVRRSTGHVEHAIRIDQLVVRLDRREVTVNDQPVHLTPKEYAILEMLSLRRGTMVSRKSLLHQLYQDTREPDPRIIDVFISKIRRKLAQSTGGEPYIETVKKGGFLLRTAWRHRGWDSTATPADAASAKVERVACDA